MMPQRSAVLAGCLLALGLWSSAGAATPGDSLPGESPPAPVLIPGRPAPPPPDLKERKAEARQVYEEARQLELVRPTLALVSYRKALRIDPTIPDAHYRIGMLFNSRGRWAEA